MSALDRILKSYRDAAVTEREKGTYFERLSVTFLKNDLVQRQQYSDVWTFGEWAAANGEDGRDTGIDLVAKLRDQEGFVAIQCKFYSPQHRVQKKDIDSFLSASSRHPFIYRVVIDTTEVDWSDNADSTIAKQIIPVVRVGLNALRDSAIDWSAFEVDSKKIKLRSKKALLEHQQQALTAVKSGFEKHDRGKLIMACGTGKTFTALKIAENLAGEGKRVLVLVPSLALIAQTVREWTNDTKIGLRSFAVCSDVQVGKRRKYTSDVAEIEAHELDFPATTNPAKLASRAGVNDEKRMTVVFGTYQSISVLTAAQEQGLQAFDLIICDEAHRTTGAKIDGEKDSNFIQVHENKYVNGERRLYMTATPRIYGEKVRAKAADASVELCTMDDKALYGPTFFTYGFRRAVENGMLTDFKVVVLAVDESFVSRGVQNRLSANNELKLDDATKIVGCYKALIKHGSSEDFGVEDNPMRRAIAFCKDIRSSELIADEFGNVVNEFNAVKPIKGEADHQISCQVKHVDGTFNAKTRGELLHWLGDDVEQNECKILSNVRCLGEGVDVPSLDAILFLHPRKSQIDVVQSVGRVMRRAEGKKLGYVILPVVIPAGVRPEDALNDNERYKVVWQILNALRAHDACFDGTLNTWPLNKDKIEVVVVAENLPEKPQGKKGLDIGGGSGGDGDSGDRPPEQIEFIYDEFSAGIQAKIVQKCGRRTYWEDWAKDIGKIAQQHIERINATLETGVAERMLFDQFLDEIRDDLNDAVTEEEGIEMLAQHLITKPVFDALFKDHNFTAQNPVSQAMQKVVSALEQHNIGKEADGLEGFYESVRQRASGIDSAEGKQKVVVDLYEKFFKTAFPELTEKLGIVYTPVQVVDFIIHSVNDILQQEFGQTLGSEGVHILDPFTGTGTFITRLLQSGLISKEQLEYKYKNEIHANEIVLLAYYIATINIEATYHALSGNDYSPFKGICLTDTFNMYESDDLVALMMEDNSDRRNRQRALDIRVIVGNPPYRAGQKSAGDNAKNVKYPALDAKIRDTYAARSTATLSRNLYDSYIRAICWANNRLGDDGGIVGFISGSGWIDKAYADGMRKCLEDECSSIYIINLRGEVRKNRLNKGPGPDGDNIFGKGSTVGISIAFFVKNPTSKQSGNVWYYDIGDGLKLDTKLATLQNAQSIKNMLNAEQFERIHADDSNDWINKRDTNFDRYITIGGKKKGVSTKLFENFSLGVVTNRDAWCYNSSASKLLVNIKKLIEGYEGERQRLRGQVSAVNVETVIKSDPQMYSWTRALRADLVNDKPLSLTDGEVRAVNYRPFGKRNIFYSKRLNEVVSRTAELFPNQNSKNRCVVVSGKGSRNGLSVLMVDRMLDLNAFDGGTQHFPIKFYEKMDADDHLVKDGITDDGLKHFQDAYSNTAIAKEDIFYYVYGLLHSKDYRMRFANNLIKDLPRIPAVTQEVDFWAFVEAGRKLGDLHVDYENAELYPVTFAEGALELATIDDPVNFYRVEKMKFAGKPDNLKKTAVSYNCNITITNIPLAAYDYVINGKSALDWVMEQQCVKADTKTKRGIENDANDYANETMKNPAYPLELFQRVITVSMETMKIVSSLPKLNISENTE